MKQAVLGDVEIVELRNGEVSISKLDYRYVTASYYDLVIARDRGGWRMALSLKPYEAPVEKGHVGTLFEEHVNEPRVFAAVLKGNPVGWIELGYDKWNNRMRIWEFLVKKEFRRMGVGGRLMRLAAKVSRERGARMLVLETQSCNVPAINFYRKQGFNLIGFDSAAYSNGDIAKREVRLELGRPLDGSLTRETSGRSENLKNP